MQATARGSVAVLGDSITDGVGSTTNNRWADLLPDRLHGGLGLLNAGIRVIGGTLVPFKGWRVWDETLEATRQAVNDFIRHSHEFDAAIDFDAGQLTRCQSVRRQPANPPRCQSTNQPAARSPQPASWPVCCQQIRHAATQLAPPACRQHRREFAATSPEPRKARARVAQPPP